MAPHRFTLTEPFGNPEIESLDGRGLDRGVPSAATAGATYPARHRTTTQTKYRSSIISSSTLFPHGASFPSLVRDPHMVPTSLRRGLRIPKARPQIHQLPSTVNKFLRIAMEMTQTFPDIRYDSLS